MSLKRMRLQCASLVLVSAVAALVACSAVKGNALLQSEQMGLLSEIETALAASDADWPAARDRLVCSAHEVLAVLNARKVLPSQQSRVTELISQALLHKIPSDEFRARYGALHALVEPEIERRRRTASMFTQLEQVHRGSFHPGCVDYDCPKSAFQQAEADFEKLPGLSIPVLQELARHSRPAVRLYALLRMFELGSSLAAMSTAELLRNDTVEVPVAMDDLEHQLHPVNAYAAISGPLAVHFAEWNAPTAGTPDGTEQSMFAALDRAVTLKECKWSTDVKAIIARDAWGRAIRVAGTPGGIVMWSHGPNGSAGDGDDIVRFLRDCRDFRSGASFNWTAAGGGRTALPPAMKAKCN